MTSKNEQDLYGLWEKFSGKQIRNDELEYLAEEKFNRPIKAFLEQEFSQNIGEKILDVGSGLYSDTYLPQGHEVYSVDWLPQVKKIKKSYVCNVESMPFDDNAFGVVLLKQVYGYLINPEKCLDEMARVLKPNGLLMVIDWEGNLKGENFRVENFEPEKVASKVKSMGFEITKSVRLIDRTKVIKDVYLTAIVARKNSDVSIRVDLE